VGHKFIRFRPKNANACCIFAACVFACTAPAMAGSASGTGNVALVTPLSLIQVTNLDFGRLIPGATGGRVTLTPAGVFSTTGSIIPVGNTHHVAVFAGQGTTNQRVQINITNSIFLTGPGANMLLDNLDFGADPSINRLGNSPNFRIVPATGIFTFPVGGRLTVGANQAGGVYTGTYVVTANYQ
jgi:hypothetical protein